MLRKGAALLALVIVAGCGSSTVPADQPETTLRHLVYQKLVGETGIWIADADGGHAQLLVSDGHAPVISPDGKLVGYLGSDWDSCLEPTAPRCDQVYVVPTSGGEKPRLLAKGFGGGMWWFGGTMRWSADSKRIITLRSSSDDLASIDVASGKANELAKGKFWGWSLSPDGEQIVFARPENRDAELLADTGVDLFVADLDGGAAKRITDTGDAALPVWGPKSIAFSKVISCPGDGCKNYAWGRHEIWRVQPDGTGQTSITGSYATRHQGQGCVGLFPVDWSEDGRALLGAWLCELTRVPVAVDPETGVTRELGWQSEINAAQTVALSPDGSSVLLQGDTGPETPPDKETVLIAPYAGGNPKLVAKGAMAPSWNR